MWLIPNLSLICTVQTPSVAGFQMQTVMSQNLASGKLPREVNLAQPFYLMGIGLLLHHIHKILVWECEDGISRTSRRSLVHSSRTIFQVNCREKKQQNIVLVQSKDEIFSLKNSTLHTHYCKAFSLKHNCQANSYLENEGFSNSSSLMEENNRLGKKNPPIPMQFEQITYVQIAKAYASCMLAVK